MPPATPGATPGKGKRERAYVLFNDKPRERGTHTGKLMPTDVPLNEDGFEDPNAFMNSPTVTESVTNSASRRTTIGGLSSVGTSRRLTGRMSQLDDGSDEDELHMGPDAVLEEEDFDVTTTTFFGVSNPAKVPLPRRSELAPATPGTNFDDIPSPSVSASRSVTKSLKRKSTLAGSPSVTSRRSMATTVNQTPPADQSLEYDDDSMLLNDEDDVNTSPRSRRQSRRDTIATENGGESSIDTSRHRNDRKSMASRKSYATEQSLDDIGDEDDQAPEQSYTFDNGPADDGGEEDGPAEYGGEEDEEEELADEEQAEAEIALEEDQEQEPVEESGGESGEETAVERPRPKAKKGQATKTKTKSKIVQRQRGESSSSSDTSPIKKARVSGFPIDQAKDKDNGYEGDFKCRRSGRSHIKPLKWWRGDHVEYEPGEFQAEVKEVVRMTDEVKPVRKRTYRKGTKRTREPSHDSTVLNDGTGFDENTKEMGTVVDYATGEEIDNKRVAWPHRLLDPALVKGGEFKYQKIFGEDAFAAAGIIRIPVGKKKPGKPSRDNAFFFFVHKGGVNVNLHRTSFNMGPGAMFYVPRGNKYSIENLSDVEAELFFSQARKADSKDEEELRKLRNESVQSEATSTVRPNGKKAKTKSVEPETDAETTPASKKKKKIGKK